MERLRQKASKASKILLVCLTATVSGCQEDKPQIEKLTVLKDDLPLANIKDSKTLARINDIISESPKVEKAECEWTHTLITQYENGMNSRWLYCEKGYMVVFSKRLYPIYKIADAEEFNGLILK